MPALGTEPRVGAPFGAQVGDFPLIPEEYQDAVNYGIRFFELRWPKTLYHDERIFGPFDVRVTGELEPGGNRIRYNAVWRTAESAQVRFQVVNKRGLALAFMPDDKEWHNRVLLVDNPGLQVHQYHTKDGIVPGNIIRAELRVLFEELYEPVTIYRVIDARGREVGFGYTTEEAEKVRRQRDVARDTQTNVIREVQPYLDCEVVQGQKWVKKERVRDLVQAHRTMVSWTHCDVFQQEIKPRVMKLIEQSRPQAAAEPSPLTAATILEMFRNATPEERAGLRNLLTAASQGQGQEVAPPDEGAEQAPGPEPTAFEAPESTEDLSSLTVAELRERLEELVPDFPVNSLRTKANLIAAIRRHQTSSAAPEVPPHGPPDETEEEETVT